jgi:hypothetical protein
MRFLRCAKGRKKGTSGSRPDLTIGQLLSEVMQE